MEVEVAREQTLYRMAFERGKPKGKLEKLGELHNRRGTKVRFQPDPEIFGAKAHFKPQRLFKMARSKAYLFGGVEIRWSCDQGAAARRRGRAGEGRPSISPTASRTISAAAINGARWCIRTSSPATPARPAPRRRRMGGRLDGGRRRLPLLLLQHHPDAGRRHARVRPAQRAARASRITPSASARASARPASPATT